MWPGIAGHRNPEAPDRVIRVVLLQRDLQLPAWQRARQLEDRLVVATSLPADRPAGFLARVAIDR